MIDDQPAEIRSISAVTLSTQDMDRAVGFYRSLGFRLLYGGPEAGFSSFAVGAGFLNLMAQTDGEQWSGWGRVILHVTDVDRLYRRVIELGYTPEAPPRDAPWGERYFHLSDPDGHELSFALPLPSEMPTP